MIKAALLDLSGVLYVGATAVPGAIKAVELLRSLMPVRFLTNSTRSPKHALHLKLTRLGFQLDADEIFTPSRAACDWLSTNGYAPHLLVYPDLEADFAGCPTTGPVAVVVGDAGAYFTYDVLNAAFRELHNGAPFLALAANRTFSDDDGKISMDVGAFVTALTFSSGVEPLIMGKPAKGFFAAAANSMGVKLSETVMVGDDAEADVAGALQAGLASALLVQTGKYRARDETRFDPPPSCCVADVGAAVDWILAQHAD